MSGMDLPVLIPRNQAGYTILLTLPTPSSQDEA